MGVCTLVTRHWRLESFALLALWAAATALLVGLARIPLRPALRASFARAAVPPVAPARRPSVRRPVRAPRTAVPVPAASAEPRRAEEPASAAPPEVFVTGFEDIELLGYRDGYEDGEPFDPNLEFYRFQYAFGRGGNRWGHNWRGPFGRSLRPAASAFFADRAVPLGSSGDPCAVIPGACSAVSTGGVFAPPTAAAAVAAPTAVPATLTRDGDLWRLGNGQITLDFDALCQMTARRADDPTAAVANFAPPVRVPCVLRETAVPWDDRAGAAIELTWDAPAGSMRAVVALGDDGDAAEASVARTDASGETWLTNLGKTALTWTVGGSPVTVAPGAAVRVVVRRSARA